MQRKIGQRAIPTRGTAGSVMWGVRERRKDGWRYGVLLCKRGRGDWRLALSSHDRNGGSSESWTKLGKEEFFLRGEKGLSSVSICGR